MTKIEPKKPPRLKNAVLDALHTTFKVFRDCQPLALGIHKVITERRPEIDAHELRTAMKIHTAATRYLKALSRADTRYDLDGLPAGEVTAEQRQQALETLRARFEKKAEAQKAEAQARQLTQQQELREARRQDKLRQLAAKFNLR